MTLARGGPVRAAAHRAYAHVGAGNGEFGTAAEPIAVIGLACRLPGEADSPDALWRLLRGGQDATGAFPPERGGSADGDTLRGGFLHRVGRCEPEVFGITPDEARAIGPEQWLALEVAWEALEHGGYAPDGLDGSPTGVWLGVSTAQPVSPAAGHTPYAGYGTYPGGGGQLGAVPASGTARQAAERISRTFGLRGPSRVIDTAGSSSLVALHEACQALRGGECELALAGGVSLLASPYAVRPEGGRTLAADGRCRPFDAAADGWAPGEGAGLVLLKRYADAVRDGDQVAAVVRGSAVNHDGRGSAPTVPGPAAQRQLIEAALARAGVSPAEIGYVEAHGTGSPTADPVELRAIEDAVARPRAAAPRAGHTRLPVGSVKSNIGDPGAAAGIAGLLKLVLALQHGEIPPHLHFTQPAPTVDWERLHLEVAAELRAWPAPRTGAVSSFGAAGTSAHCVLSEASATPVPPAGAGARGGTASTYVNEGQEGDAGAGEVGPSGVTSVNGVPYVDGVTYVNGVPPVDAAPPASPPGTPFTYANAVPPADTAPPNTPPTPETTFTAPRQALFLLAAHTDDALAELARRHARHLRRAPGLALADACWTTQVGRARQRSGVAVAAGSVDGVADALEAYARGDHDARLVGVRLPGRRHRRTAWLFTAEDASYAGMARGLAGERVFREAFDRCAAEFGLPLAAALWPVTGEPRPLVDRRIGQPALFAVQYALACMWRSWGLRPGAVIGFGAGEAAAACAAGVLSLEDAVRLAAARAALPPRPDGAQWAAFEQAVRELRHQDPELPFYSATTGRPWEIPAAPGDAPGAPADAAVAYWRRQAAAPVRGYEAVNRLYEDGVGTFLEIGPASVLAELDSPAVGDAECAWVPSLHRPGDIGPPDDHIAARLALGTLHLRGAAVDWAAVHRDGRPPRRVALPTTVWRGTAFWPGTGPDAAHAAHAAYGAPAAPGAAHDATAADAASGRRSAGHGGRPVPPVPSPGRQLLGLGRRLRSAQPIYEVELDDPVWEPIVRADRHGRRYLPLGGLATVALAAAADGLDGRWSCVEELVVHERVPMEREGRVVQMMITSDGDGHAVLEARSISPAEEAAGAPWRLHCRGVLRRRLSARPRAASPANHLHVHRYDNAVPYESAYLSSALVDAVTGAHRGGGGVVVALAPERGEGGLAWVEVLDAAVAALSWDAGQSGVAAEAGTASHLTDLICEDPQRVRYVRATVRNRRGSLAHPAGEVAGEVEFFAEDGGHVGGVRELRVVSTAAVEPAEPPWRAPADLLHRVTWQPAEPLEPAGDLTGHRFLLVADRRGVTPRLAAELRRRGAECEIVSAAGDPAGPTRAPAAGNAPDRASGEPGTPAPDQAPGARSPNTPAPAPNAPAAAPNAPAPGAKAAPARAGTPARVGTPARPGIPARADLPAALASWLAPRADTPSTPVTSNRVVLLTGLDAPEPEDADPDLLREYRDSAELALITLLREVTQRQNAAGATVSVVTRGAVAAGEQGRVTAPFATALWGLGRACAAEHPALWGTLVDLDPLGAGADDIRALGAALADETGEDEQALRENERFVARLVRSGPAAGYSAVAPDIRPTGAYLVTGAFGAVGRRTGRWLAENGAGKLVLLTRTPMPRRAEWDLPRHSPAVRERIAWVRELEATGVLVEVVAADVGDVAQLLPVMEQLAVGTLPLRGVLHAAGNPGWAPGAAPPLDPGSPGPYGYPAVWRTRVLGGWLLHQLTEGLDLDFFVAFGSLAAVLGRGPGGAPAAAADAFLDGLAEYRRACGQAALAVTCSPWAPPPAYASGTAIAAPTTVRDKRADGPSATEGVAGDASPYARTPLPAGVDPLAAAQCVKLLAALLAGDTAHAVVCAADWAEYAAGRPAGGREHPLLRGLVEGPGDGVASEIHQS